MSDTAWPLAHWWNQDILAIFCLMVAALLGNCGREKRYRPHWNSLVECVALAMGSQGSSLVEAQNRHQSNQVDWYLGQESTPRAAMWLARIPCTCVASLAVWRWNSSRGYFVAIAGTARRCRVLTLRRRGYCRIQECDVRIQKVDTGHKPRLCGDSDVARKRLGSTESWTTLSLRCCRRRLLRVRCVCESGLQSKVPKDRWLAQWQSVRAR